MLAVFWTGCGEQGQEEEQEDNLLTGYSFVETPETLMEEYSDTNGPCLSRCNDCTGPERENCIQKCQNNEAVPDCSSTSGSDIYYLRDSVVFPPVEDPPIPPPTTYLLVVEENSFEQGSYSQNIPSKFIYSDTTSGEQMEVIISHFKPSSQVMKRFKQDCKGSSIATYYNSKHQNYLTLFDPQTGGMYLLPSLTKILPTLGT